MVDLGPLVDAIATEVEARVARLLEAQQSAPQALRMADAGKLIGLSEREVQRLVLDGRLRSFKIGRVRLIPPSAIREFVAVGMGEMSCVSDTQSRLRQGATGADGSTMPQKE